MTSPLQAGLRVYRDSTVQQRIFDDQVNENIQTSCGYVEEERVVHEKEQTFCVLWVTLAESDLAWLRSTLPVD